MNSSGESRRSPPKGDGMQIKATEGERADLPGLGNFESVEALIARHGLTG